MCVNLCLYLVDLDLMNLLILLNLVHASILVDREHTHSF